MEYGLPSKVFETFDKATAFADAMISRENLEGYDIPIVHGLGLDAPPTYCEVNGKWTQVDWR